MKFLKLLFFSIFLLSLFSCGGDDDICVSGEATPRMKIKFKTQASGKLKTLDSLFIKVDYGNGPIAVVANASKTDSVIIPLRVDDSPFTKIYVGLSKDAVNSVIKINYNTVSEYVSPACGIKKTYKDLNSIVETPAAVLSVEQNQNQITDESKTHLFLLF
ncbi:hypothetical protein FNJ88_04215 [Chryseobacterium sp. SNU WT5]|uniref:DUF6452 family protein n=1 Tax=Chryseobacterium sp. SNU WT5 TaxID=2594269 RepID=UPI00117C5455|nr:DUF6452 family protein [Chryseobacterium sp. SNU WT5]QDP84793.1 hypothetical protein FNJ88_04215 [Chryseobacterium sp. SNU WT5]